MRVIGRRSWSLVAVFALVAASAGAAVTAVLLPRSAPQTLASARPPDTIVATHRSHADARSVQLDLEAGPIRTVRAPIAGVLTSLDAAIGAPIADGGQVATIDGRPVIALHTAVPMWRDLHRGDRGDDVRALQDSLRRLGETDVVTDGLFGARTERAARRLLSIGVADAPETFPATSIAWLPSTTAVVRDCPTAVGSAVDSASILASFPAAIRAARLASTPVDAVAGARELLLDGTTVPMDTDGTVTDDAALERLRSRLDDQLGAPSTDGAPTATATWRLRDPIDVAVVPPTSVRVLSWGRGCIDVPGDHAVLVDIVGSELGQTFVAPQHGALPDRVSASRPTSARCR
jgi:peptidoglycan hydrolase-like protein with peptidoglycan-binding domain